MNERRFTLAEITKIIPHHHVEEVGDTFEISPNNVCGEHLILIIPTTLPVCSINNHPINYTHYWEEDVVEQILSVYDAIDYDPWYRTYCRFGRYSIDERGRHSFRITPPDHAAHIQLVGVIDRTYDGPIVEPLRTEEQLSSISLLHHTAFNIFTQEETHEWILGIGLHTKPIVDTCADIWNEMINDC